MHKSGFKIGLALGGGGARGLAHIGVLKVFRKEGIPIDIIVGTSMGAIVGATYALSGDPYQVEKVIREVVERKEIQDLASFAAESPTEEKRLLLEKLADFVKSLFLWNLKAVKKYMVEGSQIERLIKILVGDKDFSQARIPFISVATDLVRGEEVDLTCGKLSRALLASSAMPGVFSPVEIEGRTLVDGGVMGSVPVECARRFGADFVIAVNVGSKIYQEKFRSGMEILFQTDEIGAYELNRVKLQFADFVITPKLQNLSWASFSKAEDCIRKGEEAARECIGELKKKIAKKQKRLILRKLIPFISP